MLNVLTTVPPTSIFFVFQEIERTILELCEDWDDLKERAGARFKRLEDSRDLHSFKNNMEDTRTWIQEKQGMLMGSEDLGKDCLTVKKLIRKHDELKVLYISSMVRIIPRTDSPCGRPCTNRRLFFR